MTLRGTSGAVVLTRGDVVEDGGVGGAEVVDDLVEEAQGVLAGLNALGVDEGDHTSEHGGAGGGAVSSSEVATDDEDVGVASDGDIGVAATLRSEHVGGGGCWRWRC